jgi:1-acyl-sn-glycerol-3-phosphate acyltransferase
VDSLPRLVRRQGQDDQVATNAGVHWPAHGFLRRPGTIVFEYLEPIPPGLKRAEFMRVLEERIETRSAELLAL